MALFFNLNKNPSNHVGSVMYLWQTMVAAGWVVHSYSDGLQATPSGSPGPGFLGFLTSSTGVPVHTSATPGSANNNRAWIILTQPIAANGTPAPYSGSRQVSFQKGTTSNAWRVKYSHGGGYLHPASAGTTTTTPVINATVDDEALVVGGGTDGSPTFANLIPTALTDGAVRIACMADDGVSGSATPYGFALIGWPAGGTAAGHALVFDPLAPGSTAPGDVDPFVFYAGQTNASVFLENTTTFTSDETSNTCPMTWFNKTSSNRSFTPVAALYYYVTTSGGSTTQRFTQAMGGNSYNAYDDFLPIFYGRRASLGGNTGYKGLSTLMRWNGTAHFLGDTFSINNPGTTRDRFSVDSVNFPWDGSTVPMI